MNIVICVLGGFILDLILGDPRWLPHPIRFIGGLISTTERLLRRIFKGSDRAELVGGVFLTIIVVALTFGVAYGILLLAGRVHPYFRLALELFFCYQIFATKSLRQESMRVYREIKEENLPEARKYLSWIVGRDTENLNFTQITKAVIETVAENASDGVIAPLIFMVIGGAPLAFAYKAVNTLDSMVGYKNDKYLYFGRFSAKVDDLLNLIPARITGLAFVLAAFALRYDGRSSFRIYLRDRKNHSSPNSAHPESACAGALNIQLAGDAYYFGKLYKKKTIGDDKRPVEAEDIVKTNRLMYLAAASCLVLFTWVRFMAVVL